MTQERGNLKAKEVEKLLRAGKPGSFYDGAGLRLEIKSKKSASWVARYQLNGKISYMGLGSAADFSLVEARQRNRRLIRQKLADGIDPLAVRQAERAAVVAAAAKAVTFADAVRQYLQQHSGKWSNAKHASQWEVTLRDYAVPIIGKLPVASIDVPLVLKVLEQPVPARGHFPAGTLWLARPETANRLRGRIEAVLDWGKARSYRSGDNPAAWHVIGKVLPARGAQVHLAALAYKDLPAFMQDLRALDGTAARALEFLILTAARSQEVIEARWAEFDLDAGIWAVPAQRMKMRREHRVPLAPQVIELLRGLPHEGDGDGFVFIGSQAGRPLHHAALRTTLARVRPGVTVHGFRSAFRDWAGEHTAFPHDVCEAALAHVKGRVVRAYQRGDLLDRRRKLMEAWSQYLASPPLATSATVTALREVRP